MKGREAMSEQVTVRSADGYAGDLECADAWRMLEADPQAVLVDVRTRAEWDFVGVPDVSDLGGRVAFVQWQDYPSGTPNPEFVDTLRPLAGRPLIFLCRSGGRSVAAALAATAAGLGPAYNVLDGFEGDIDASGRRGATGWRAVGLPWRHA